MIDNDEAFWAGIAVATMMLGGGFSMLFLRTFTGYGAIVLSLGLMTMALTLQARAKANLQYIEPTAPVDSQVLVPTPPVKYPTPLREPEPLPEPENAEPKESESQQVPTEVNEKLNVETVQPSQTVESATSTASTTGIAPTDVKPAQTETNQPNQQQPAEISQPLQSKTTVEKKTEPQKAEERPREEAQAAVATS